MNKLNKVTYVGSKVVEVIGWMMFVIALVGLILGMIQPQVYTMILTEGNIPLNIHVGSIGIEVLDQSMPVMLNESRLSIQLLMLPLG